MPATAALKNRRRGPGFLESPLIWALMLGVLFGLPLGLAMRRPRLAPLPVLRVAVTAPFGLPEPGAATMIAFMEAVCAQGCQRQLQRWQRLDLRLILAVPGDDKFKLFIGDRSIGPGPHRWRLARGGVGPFARANGLAPPADSAALHVALIDARGRLRALERAESAGTALALLLNEPDATRARANP